MTPEQKEKRVLELKALHTKHKQEEKDANAKRIAVESELFALFKDEVKESGTTNHLGGLKITTGFTEKWDQVKLQEIFVDGKFGDLWPFKIEYKKDSAAIKVVKDRSPEAYLEITRALTLTPSKPSFEFKEVKE